MKSQRRIEALEKQNGVCNTFLSFLEDAIEHQANEEEIKWMIGTFIDCSTEEIRAEESWADVVSYVNRYNVDPLN